MHQNINWYNVCDDIIHDARASLQNAYHIIYFNTYFLPEEYQKWYHRITYLKLNHQTNCMSDECQSFYISRVVSCSVALYSALTYHDCIMLSQKHCVLLHEYIKCNIAYIVSSEDKVKSRKCRIKPILHKFS